MFKSREVEYNYGKINLLYDSRKKDEKQLQIVEGDEETIASLLGATIGKLLDGGFDRQLLEYAILKALTDSKKEKSKKNIQVHEIHVSKESEKEFAQILDKILKGDK